MTMCYNSLLKFREEHQTLTGEYIIKLKESTGNQQSLQFFDQRSGQTVIQLMNEKWRGDVDSILFPSYTTKYIQELYVQTIHDYKYIVKRMVDIFFYPSKIMWKWRLNK